jgi:hypothetical protein
LVIAALLGSISTMWLVALLWVVGTPTNNEAVVDVDKALSVLLMASGDVGYYRYATVALGRP